jgi:hypothetical protein
LAILGGLLGESLRVCFISCSRAIGASLGAGLHLNQLSHFRGPAQAPGITGALGSGENRISLRPRHRETSRISYGIKIGEVRIWSPTSAMIIVGVTASPPVM